MKRIVSVESGLDKGAAPAGWAFLGRRRLNPRVRNQAPSCGVAQKSTAFPSNRIKPYQTDVIIKVPAAIPTISYFNPMRYTDFNPLKHGLAHQTMCKVFHYTIYGRLSPDRQARLSSRLKGTLPLVLLAIPLSRAA